MSEKVQLKFLENQNIKEVRKIFSKMENPKNKMKRINFFSKIRVLVFTSLALVTLFSTAVFSSTNTVASISSYIFNNELVSSRQPVSSLMNKITNSFTAQTISLTEDGSPNNPDFATVTTDRTDYNPGETVVITGNGFDPFEQVSLTILREGVEAAAYQVAADQYGNIINREFVIGADDLGASFVLNAAGATSGKTASYNFTDGSMSYTTPNQNFIGGSAITAGSSKTFQLTVRSPLNISNPPCSGAYGTFQTVLEVTPNTTTVGGNITTLFPTNFTVSTNPGQLTFANPDQSKTWNTVSISVPAGTPSGFYSALFKAIPDTNCHNAGSGIQVVLEVKAPAPTDNIAPSTLLTSGNYDNNSWTNQDVNVSLSATDNTGGTGVKSISYKIDEGLYVTTFGSSVTVPTFTNEGSYSITYFATDNAGNDENSAVFHINIDKTAPVLSLPTDITVNADDATGKIVNYSATSTDRSPATPTVNCTPASGSKFSIGTTTVNCSATDDVGNTSNGSFKVIVNKADQTITFDALADKTYGDANFGVSATASSDLTVSFSSQTTGVCTTGGTNGATVTIVGVGTCTIRASQAGNTNYNAAADVDQSFTVNQKTVNGSFTAQSKTYDGNTNATILTRSISSGIVGNDVVTLTGGTASFDNKNVGTDKTVTGTGFVLGGANAGNYILGTVATTTADITAKNLTVNGAVANNKVYDGNTTATVNFGAATLADVVGSDVVTIDSSAYSASFADRNVSNGKSVTVLGVALGGAGAGNYTVSQPTGLTANITAATVTGSFTAQSKIYDGSASATILMRSITGGTVGSDVVTLTGGTASFDNKNVGTDKTVTGTGFVLGGADAGNYQLGTVATTTANITPKTLTASISADNKEYNGNNAASFNCSLAGVINPDDVQCTGGTASFDTKDVGNGKTVTATGLGLSGADASNYSVNSTASTTAKITPKTLTATVDANSKYFDDNTSATINSCSFTGVVSGDNVSCVITGYVANFDTKNVGTNKTVTATGLSKTGTDAGNYSFSGTGTGTASIGAWTINGFYQPVDMFTSTGARALNTVKGGSTVPLKFNLWAGTTEMKAVSDVKSFQAAEIGCTNFTATDELPLEITTTGGTSLRYDTTGGQFIQNWQTPKQVGRCYQVRMTSKDGTFIDAFFKTK